MAVGTGDPDIWIPRSVVFLFPTIGGSLVWGSRQIAALLLVSGLDGKPRLPDRTRVLIYGAGTEGVRLLEALRNSPDHEAIGFLDDAPSLIGQQVGGLKVYRVSKLARFVERDGVKEVLLALPRRRRSERQEIIRQLAQHTVRVKTMPAMEDIAAGRVSVSDLRPIDVDDLLSRDAVPPDAELLARSIRGKSVMVTGAGGSIGRELVRQILRQGPCRLVLLEISEAALYEVETEVRDSFAHLEEPAGGASVPTSNPEIVAVLGSVGDARLLEQTMEWLERRAVSLPRLAGDERRALEELANRNLFFNRFYALGRFIDTEELACVTSRSPLYYVSAAFWARDTLLWSLPGVLRIDPERARELLLTCFRRHLRNAGVHAHYVDGTVVYPGFELDELCAYLIGLEHYCRATGDERLLAEPVISEGVAVIEQKLLARRHPREWLLETTLFPSDDPATQPYLTYDNALAARSFEILFEWEQRGLRPPGPGKSNRERARRIREAIHRHLVVEGPFGPMYAWSTDLGQPPRQEIYDEPPGSLQLLSHYGLCAADDPLFVNTVKWVHSPHNPHCYLDCAFPEVGCPHAEHPFVMGLFNSLLSGRAEQAKAILLRAPLDGGLACESFDRNSGLVRTGAAFATCAGFLGHAICCAFGTP
jgi:hypothetical protein